MTTKLKENVQAFFDSVKDNDIPLGGLYEKPEGFTVSLVQQAGGGEGGGEYCYAVYECTDFTDEKLYVKCEGRYYSHYGTEYYGSWGFVKPRQVVVTQYG